MKFLQSKKLLAYLIAELTWKGLLGIALWRDPSEGAFPRWTLITMVVVTGFLEVGYILGQAYVDQFVHATRLRLNVKNEKGDD
ncbi:MAG: hypothetical protein EBT79_02490 [Actinobacteria bacterium]|nr:hypothetical protein [Actinomycetota bacterium]NBR66144.1 hypothetical protein [Actinomycetota bacterium]